MKSADRSSESGILVVGAAAVCITAFSLARVETDSAATVSTAAQLLQPVSMPPGPDVLSEAVSLNASRAVPPADFTAGDPATVMTMTSSGGREKIV